MIKTGQSALVIAPMEGITDAPMRALLSERGGFTHCVSEFFRISQDIPPARALIEHVPEFRTACKTASGLPVQIQFLGGNPDKLAEASFRACGLGAQAIDLNFGCPAPTVNRNDGGATLLKYPLRIRAIVEAVRKAVPSHVPVSAKLRLGWDSHDPIHENSEQAAAGGADWITIHGRTKVQGYAPPAYWGPIAEVRKRLKIPVIANGDIWTLEDFLRCRDQTQCDHFMIGRSALSHPGLPHLIAKELGIAAKVEIFEFTPEAWKAVLDRFVSICMGYEMRDWQIVGRLKQWMKFGRMRETFKWFDQIKTEQTVAQLMGALEGVLRSP